MKRICLNCLILVITWGLTLSCQFAKDGNEDKNLNGLRDEIEVWIKHETASDRNLQLALLEYAIEFNKLLSINLSDFSGYRQQWKKTEDSKECIFFLNEARHYAPDKLPIDYLSSTRKKSLNNLFRVLFYEISNLKLRSDDRLYKVRPPVESIKWCKFKIENIENYIPKSTSKDDLIKILEINNSK